MTIDYQTKTFNYNDLSVSPKTQIGYMCDPSGFIQKRKSVRQMKKPLNEEITEQLQTYKFPKTPTNNTITSISNDDFTTPLAHHSYQPQQYRRKSSILLTRRPSHRRSAAISGASSNESIFSDSGALISSSASPTMRPAKRTSVHTEMSSVAPMSPITPTKLDFDEICEQKGCKKPELKPIDPGYPIIDLNIASKPLKPSLGSPLQTKDTQDGTVWSYRNTCAHGPTGGLFPEEEEEVEEGEESISIIDFLRESISERAMSVGHNYDPFQYIHLNKGMCIEDSVTSLNIDS